MSQSSAGLPLPDRRTRLLVVEDELTTVFALRSFFALAGYDVDCAAGLLEGLHLLERNDYDAILTDLQLTPARRGEGLDIVSRGRVCNPRACIVLLTAFDSEHTERHARRAGADLYYTKPVALPQLRDEIDTLLSERVLCRPH
jgi:DNA-binding response OmpR family regulator